MIANTMRKLFLPMALLLTAAVSSATVLTNMGAEGGGGGGEGGEGGGGGGDGGDGGNGGGSAGGGASTVTEPLTPVKSVSWLTLNWPTSSTKTL